MATKTFKEYEESKKKTGEVEIAATSRRRRNNSQDSSPVFDGAYESARSRKIPTPKGKPGLELLGITVRDTKRSVSPRDPQL